MIKVLEITGNKPLGGVKTFLKNYQKEIDKTKVVLDYLFFEDYYQNDDFDEFISQYNSSIFLAPSLKISNYFKIKKELNLFFKKHHNDYSCIHIHSPNIVFLIHPFIKKYGIKNVIVHSHATMYSDKKINAIRNRILCFNLDKKYDYAIACSKEAGHFLFRKKNFIVLNNAIDCERFNFSPSKREMVRNELNINGKTVLCHAGIFNEQKNHLFLIKLLSFCLKNNSNYVLLLLGEGPLQNAVRNYVKKEGLNDFVFFLGQKNNIEDYFSASDLFVLPSLFEGLPLVGIEAQANGMPCVFSDAITKEISITNCKFVSLDDPLEVWHNAITEAIAQCRNRSSASKMISEAGYNIKKEGKKLEDFYISISKENDDE